jgi:hypothetical protein
MPSQPRLLLPLVAAAVFGTAVSFAPAASAAETVSGREFAGTGSSLLRHKPAQQVRVAASGDHRRDRYVSSSRNAVDCSTWCGRQFVLMIGIAY